MYSLKGFIPNKNFVINAPNKNSVIGELSQIAATFSTEIGFYTNDAYSKISLISFFSQKDGVNIEAANTTKDTILKIAEYIYDKTLNGTGPIYADQLLVDLTNDFAKDAQTFASGEIITDGSYYVPEWVSFSLKSITEENYIRIWFADASLQEQYDEFEIKVVPPLANLDDFFKTGYEVKTAVNAVSTSEVIENAQAAKGDKPETVMRLETFNYIDPSDATNIVPTDWVVLIYGPAGDNLDSIKNALIDYVLANSTHSRDDWIQIMPDLFRRTEFIFVPRWDKFAIPNRTSVSGIYSAVTNIQDNLTVINDYGSTYNNATHINNNATVLANPYKSLSMVSIGSPENRNSLYQINQVYTDLINVSSTSPDFARMSQPTQNFLLKMADMVVAAESMGPYTSIPKGYSKVTRNGKLYIVAFFDNIYFLVAAAYNFQQS